MPSKYSSPGFNTALILIPLAVLIIGALAAFTFFNQSPPAPPNNSEDSTPKDTNAMMADPAPNTQALPNEPETMVDKATNNGTTSHQGTRLAGTSAPLLEFTPADYQAALKSNKLIVLYFYANWCPVCREEFPKMQAAFDQLKNDQVIGFQVNFNDDETEAAETELARQYGVPYQHTKVFVKNGQQILKSPESWGQSRYLAEIEKALN